MTATPLMAMTLETKGNILFASGAIADDYAAFDTALKDKQIDTIVLVNSPGGDLWNGLRIARMIAGKSLKTVVAGRCVSSCSLLFMGGKERKFADTHPPGQTYIGVHGPHNKDTHVVSPQAAVELYAFYKMQMGDRFNHEVMNMALQNMKDSSGLLRVYDGVRTPRRDPIQCPSFQSPPSECKWFKEADAYSLGFVTSIHFEKVELPTSMAHAYTLFGQPLTTSYEDYSGFLAGPAKKRCDTFSCEHEMRVFEKADPYNAIALAPDGEGMGYSAGQSTAENAYFKALSTCNFSSGDLAKLCEVQTLNGLDVRPLYKGQEEAHAKAIKEVKVPALKFYGSEEYGGVFTRADGLRTQKWTDITPTTLDAITTLGTAALAERLVSGHPPLLIDTSGGAGETLPTALMLANGGFAYDDPKREATYQKRFERLLKVLAPQREVPVVFFSYSRESWLSVNAALRAKALGFTQVYWYRGGIDAWKQAGLPLVKSLPRASVL